MSYQGYAPTLSPLTPGQIRPVADQLYRRIDGANMPLDIFKNALINASFDYWQRGTSFSGGGYSADRWAIGQSGGAVAVTQQALTSGELASESQYYARVAISGQGAAGNYVVFRQMVESSRRFAGKRCILRGMVRSSAAANMFAEVEQNFGSGGSVGLVQAAGLIPLSTIWTPFSIFVNVPSLAGKTVGVGDFLYVSFWLSGLNGGRLPGLTYQNVTVDFADLEFKEVIAGYGDQVPGFERAPRDIELLRCQRYYQVGTAVVYRSNASSSYGGALTNVRLVPMRVTPTVTVSNAGGGNISGGLVASGVVNSVSDITIWPSAAGNPGDFTAATYTASAEF